MQMLRVFLAKHYNKALQIIRKGGNLGVYPPAGHDRVNS